MLSDARILVPLPISVLIATIAMATGRLVVKITDHTNISADGDLKTLGGVAEAMEAGQTVIAVGKGRVVVESDALLIKASQVLFKIVATG